MVKLLLDRGASPVDRDSRGAGPLLHAVSARQAAVVALLLELNAPVNDTDERGLTPLVAAIGAGDAALARQLLRAGATIGKAVNGSPPLHVAAERGDLAVIEALLEGRPDLDALDSFGETALLVAARQGQEAVCARLLSAGANIRLRGRDRATAADVAESRGFVALARRLRG
jgi:ankyrin repeat protein